jgi:hypothetical protein
MYLSIRYLVQLTLTVLSTCILYRGMTRLDYHALSYRRMKQHETWALLGFVA